MLLTLIYKQFNKITHSPIDQILINRGIPENQLSEWTVAGWPHINSPWLFGTEKVKHALKIMVDSILDCKEIYVLVDCDADGFTSAAIIINYLYKIFPDCQAKIHYILHTGKQHGLEDTIDEFPNDCLIILPDSSTNDKEQMRQLLDRGCAIVCMDHHEADSYLEDEDNLVIINNQLCDYPNKDMSAAGVVWQICRAWDEIAGTFYADDLIDLAALGMNL